MVEVTNAPRPPVAPQVTASTKRRPSDALLALPADATTYAATPMVPTKRSPTDVPFAPFRRSLSRGTVHVTMAPLMWLAKQALTGVLRSMGAKRHMHTTQAGRVAIWDATGKGNGPVVVLIHGLGGSSAEYFPTIAELRARCGRVIAVDLPGHGHSTALGHGAAPGFTGVHAADDRMAAAVIEAIQNHLGDTPASFIGHSLGGYMAAQVVRERQRRGIPTKLLLTETDGAPWSAQRLVHDREHFGVGSGKSARYVARCNYPQRPVLGWLYTPFLWARLASAEIVYLTHSDLKQPVLSPELLNALPTDTMVIVGAHDQFGTADDVDYLMRHLPRGARLLRPDTGHGDIADAHPAICDIFDAFFALK